VRTSIKKLRQRLGKPNPIETVIKRRLSDRTMTITSEPTVHRRLAADTRTLGRRIWRFYYLQRVILLVRANLNDPTLNIKQAPQGCTVPELQARPGEPASAIEVSKEFSSQDALNAHPSYGIVLLYSSSSGLSSLVVADVVLRPLRAINERLRDNHQ